MKSRSILLTCIATAGVLLFTRFTGSPVTDFSLDDWAFLQWAQDHPSLAGGLALIPGEPDRPLGIFFINALFQLGQENLATYNFYSAFMNIMFVFSLLFIVLELTGSCYISFLSACLFCLFPNLTENFQWHTMVGYSPGYLAYALSAAFWIRFVRSGGRMLLALSLLLYFIGLATYEFGIGLPVVYAALLLAPRERHRWGALLLFTLPATLYLSWRFTSAFGMGAGVVFASRKIAITPFYAAWNAKEILEWWVGTNMLAAITQGLEGFLTFGRMTQRLFIVSDVIMTALIAFLLISFRKQETPNSDTPNPRFPFWQVLTFGFAWAVMGHAVSLASWTGGRMNYFPAVGVALVIAVLLARFKPAYWLSGLAVLFFIFLLANQGTAKSWHDAAHFQRKLYHEIRRTAMEWYNKPYLLITTPGLRQRQTRGILEPVSRGDSAWAYHRNAGLLRGFAPEAMVKMTVRGTNVPKVLLDMEYGAEIDGNTLYWHERYNPDRPRQTPMRDVYVINSLDAVTHN